MDCKSSCTSLPPRKLRKLLTKRITEGRRLKLSKQTLQVGVWEQGQGKPPRIGGPQGSPISPLYSNIYLNLMCNSFGGLCRH